MANETSWAAPVVQVVCGDRRWHHTCIFEKGHGQDHGDKHGAWKKGSGPNGACGHEGATGLCGACGFNVAINAYPEFLK